VVLQKETPISPDDTLGTVYFDRLFPMGVKAMLEAADLVVAGKHKEVVQDESQATYEGWCRKAEAKLNWANHVDFIYNVIRGCNPAPGAWTTWAAPSCRSSTRASIRCGPSAPSREKSAKWSKSRTSLSRSRRRADASKCCARSSGDGKKVAAAELLAGGSVKAGAIVGT
jgi:methionyl-tRNA formyltransferase